MTTTHDYTHGAPIFTESHGFRRICENPALGTYIARILRSADVLQFEQMPACTPELFDIFYKTGSREEYQRVYFKRRQMLNAFAVAAFTEHGAQFARLFERALIDICSEPTWALPAHMPEDLSGEERRRVVDLFAAETAFSLAELAAIGGDAISADTRERICVEIHERVIEPFMQNEHGWEHNRDNWAAVCAAGVGAATLYIGTPAEKQAVTERVIAAMMSYLSGIGADGSCLEGYAYWQYGFGYFTYYAALLRQYTCGAADLFKLDKVRECAAFQSRVLFAGGTAVNFADCGERVGNRLGLSCFIWHEYGIPAPNAPAVMFGDDPCFRTAELLRDIVWFDENAEQGGTDYGTHYFADAEWYIKKTPRYSFAAKGGTNDEPHNHNDIGGFILEIDGTRAAADLGWGEYTREYFGAGRYDIFVNSSLSHSVPVINGCTQSAGAESCARVIAHDENTFKLDISGAYKCAKLLSAVRTFTLDECRVRVTDEFRFAQSSAEVRERIVSHSRELLAAMHANGTAQISAVKYMSHDVRECTAYVAEIVYTGESVTAVMEWDM